MRVRKNRGFSLVEILVAVVIVGILASIAVPAYQSYVRKGHRGQAMADLMVIQQSMEKWRASNPTYTGTSSDLSNFPTNTRYTYTISGAGATGYTLTATAGSTGGQSYDAEDGTSCTPMTLTVNGSTDTRAPAVCW